jgi:predicted transcriptional regulator
MESRDRLRIISLILEVASGADDPKKTNPIMYNVLLTHPKLKEYWRNLIEYGLISYDHSTQTYKTTEKGLRFLKTCNDELDEDDDDDDDDDDTITTRTTRTNLDSKKSLKKRK